MDEFGDMAQLVSSTLETSSVQMTQRLQALGQEFVQSMRGALRITDLSEVELEKLKMDHLDNIQRALDDTVREVKSGVPGQFADPVVVDGHVRLLTQVADSMSSFGLVEFEAAQASIRALNAVAPSPSAHTSEEVEICVGAVASNTIPMMVVRTAAGLPSRIEYANATAKQLFALNDEVLGGKPSLDVVFAPLDVHVIEQGICALNANKEEAKGAAAFVVMEDRGVAVNVHLSANGRFTTITCVDVSDEIKSDKHKHRILHSMAAPVVVANKEMEILYMNPFAAEVFGYEPSDLLGQRVNVLMNTSDAGRHDHYVQRYHNGESRIVGKKPRLVKGVTRDGSQLSLYLTLTEYAGTFTAVFTDVTELHAAQHRLNDVISSTSSSVMTVDTNMNIVSCNDVLLDLLGYCESDLLGASISRVLVGDDSKKHRWDVWSGRRHGGYVDKVAKENGVSANVRVIGRGPHRVTLCRFDGEEVYLHVSVSFAASMYTAVFFEKEMSRRYSMSSSGDSLASMSGVLAPTST